MDYVKDNLIFGLDDKLKKVSGYCDAFLQGGDEFDIVKNKLSITPTFLFYGLPGTGKTTIANEIYRNLRDNHNIDSYYLRIDELLSSNFGESSKNLIEFFKDIEVKNVENNSKAFVIIDELDSFTVNRYQADSESVKRVLLTFNTIIDDLFIRGIIHDFIIIATTNMENSIDTSVLRRFFFHENFNIELKKDEFFMFIKEIKSVSNSFDWFDDKKTSQLYNLYIEKKYTLGELKIIFAHLFMRLKSSDYTKFEWESMFLKDSYYEIINKYQREGGEPVDR
ncbi:AAA family ATPase [Fusibacter paucivorans]|uniref:AAA family ATPase n=1 Tax=Fusibacter paucivorans TaxID=76009 RepID=A0ABS5PQ82_9FIRM|nr:ATP-binding protein [Fusibacter paucivorans]MBS7527223.1 AAA family ATPase [Fusibacter paucivorans]